MDPERWKQIKDLFGSALELDAAERTAYLREACGGDDDLREEVEALLASHDSERTITTDGVPGANPDIAGQKIGPYEIIRQIGVGGMGVVYLAVRADETFDKRVAIKVVQSSIIGAQEVLERFRHERRILATLDHPNIAKLLDGGATAQGLPYFAMDYVEGVRIDEYCEKNSLPLAERLRLFREVCSAVQYIHQNLVVHRDLKPGNILVTRDGIPKLLDFGIAKLLGPGTRADLTQAEARPMTPGYASPEQVFGRPVTTASDVYSLGVILFELLTSESPYRLNNDSPIAWMRAVSQQEPERPSTVVAGRALSSDKLRRQLTGDLDNVVLKALQKDPQRRYASAEQLAEDIRRHQEGMPVSARPDTWAYRAGKFIQRHAVGVTAAALVVVSLAGGMAAAMSQANVARRERENAQQQFNDVRKLANSILFQFDAAIRPLPGSTPARKLVVQKALEYLNKLSRQSRGDRGLGLELAEAYLKVGDVQGNPYWAAVGDTKGAVESYSQALRISEALASNNNDTEARLFVARSHRSLGEVFPVLGKPSDGMAHLRLAVDVLEALTATDPRNELFRSELGRSYLSAGDLEGHSGLPNLGDKPAALQHYRKARIIFEEQRSRNPQDQAARRSIAVARMRIADVEMSMPGTDMTRILNEFRAALATFEQLSAVDITNAEDSFRMAYGYDKVGGALEELGDNKGALLNYSKAAIVNEKLAEVDPNNVHAGMSFAVTLRYIGDLFSKTGDRTGALTNYTKVLTILDKLSAIQPENVIVNGRRAEMMLYIADIEEQRKNLPEARRLTAGALAITRRLAARDDATSDELTEYAESFVNCNPAGLREPATALVYAKRSVEKSGGREPSALDMLAQAYFATGDPKRAIESEEKALSLTSGERRKAMESRLAKFRAALPNSKEHRP